MTKTRSDHHVRLRIVASVGGPLLLSALWSTTAGAQPPPDPTTPTPADETIAPMEPGEPEPAPPPPPATAPPTATVPPTQPSPPPQQLPPPAVEPRPAAPVDAEPRVYGPVEDDDKGQFDDSFDLYLGFGAINVPYGGRDDIDYSDSFDPGYQWGLGLGYFARADDTRFGIGVGAFFDHAMINAEDRDLNSGDTENLLRVGLELRPGIVVGERAFFYIPLRGGYTADVVHVEDDTNVEHGPMFGVAGGIDIAIFRHAYLGTAVGTDLHFFRSGVDADAYLFTWRTHLGFRF